MVCNRAFLAFLPCVFRRASPIGHLPNFPWTIFLGQRLLLICELPLLPAFDVSFLVSPIWSSHLSAFSYSSASISTWKYFVSGFNFFITSVLGHYLHFPFLTRLVIVFFLAGRPTLLPYVPFPCGIIFIWFEMNQSRTLRWLRQFA